MCPAEQTRPGRGGRLAILAGTFMKSPFERRLSTLYPNYFYAWRALFGMPVAVAKAVPLEQRP